MTLPQSPMNKDTTAQREDLVEAEPREDLVEAIDTYRRNRHCNQQARRGY